MSRQWNQAYMATVAFQKDSSHVYWWNHAIAITIFDYNSGDMEEIQLAILELLNQLYGFELRGHMKVIMGINWIETLEFVHIRLGCNQSKIKFSLPDEKM